MEDVDAEGAGITGGLLEGGWLLGCVVLVEAPPFWGENSFHSTGPSIVNGSSPSAGCPVVALIGGKISSEAAYTDDPKELANACALELEPALQATRRVGIEES